MNRIISLDRSVIPAADVVDLKALEMLLEGVQGIEKVGAVKYGFRLAYKNLLQVVQLHRSILGKTPFIFDGQKFGNDIPDLGKSLAEDMEAAGVDAVILFPFAGPATQEKWTQALQEASIEVLVGGVMTHPEFLVSEGGYISDDAPMKIYHLAAEMRVRHFVVPGTKIDWVRWIKGSLDEWCGEGEFALYAPGFVSQGGSVTDCAMVAGDSFHAIVGRALTSQPSIESVRQAATQLVSQI